MRDKDLLDRRLAALREHLRQLPPAAVTYFEDAAYHEPAFSRRVRDALLPHIDVYGLNEDEMQSYLGRPVDLLSPAEVAAALTVGARAHPGADAGAAHQVLGGSRSASTTPARWTTAS